MKNQELVLNHSMVKVIKTEETYVVAIRMQDGKHALQRPYPADQRGIVAALTLALDVLAGKVIPEKTVDLNLAMPDANTIEAGIPRQIGSR